MKQPECLKSKYAFGVATSLTNCKTLGKLLHISGSQYSNPQSEANKTCISVLRTQTVHTPALSPQPQITEYVRARVHY